MRSRNPDQREFDRPMYATAAAAADGANATLVTLTLRNLNGAPVAGEFDVRLSDNASGLGLTATTASGAVGDKTAGTTGQVIATHVAKKAFRVQTTAAGTYQLSITDTAKTPFKVATVIDGLPDVVLTLATASYG